MTSIKFTETEVPTLERAGRPKEPNPYQEVIDHLSQNVRTKDDEGKALTFTVPTAKDKDDEKAVEAALRKMREGGREIGLTIRAVPWQAEHGRKVTVWAIPLVKRERKPKNGDDA